MLDKQSKYICEFCNKNHTGSFGSGRFCSRSCMAKFQFKCEGKNSGLSAGWKEKREVKSKICPRCGEEFVPPRENPKKTYCSYKCASSRGSRSGKVKKKISKSVSKFHKNNPNKKPKFTKIKLSHCEECNSPFWCRYHSSKKYCSKQCRNNAASKRMTFWLKTHRDHIKGPHTPSYMEESFTKWLKENNAPRWFEQVYFWNEEQKKNGWADYVFPQLKLIIELDGSHHKKRKDLDAVRDEYLNRVRGYKVVRISQYEYFKQTRTEEIKSLLGLV
ncbi:hypothetical protein LCGC14_1067890 [marine sediment metagenome]|uniref:DUF559 domain-containing protein n=1 Tax=marine sediment metagenome TaxID=412755 RepID=A0A0F9QQ14_9ZZZZ